MFVFLLAQAAALSFSQLRELPPAAAGDAVLRDQQHGHIETFEAPTGGLNAPGVVDGQFVERPTVSGSGCVRRRWTVTFHAAPGAAIDTATAAGMYSTWEIAASPHGVCPSGRYVHLNPGVSVDQGWKALAHLEAVSVTGSRIEFQCSDRTSSGLCDSGTAIRSGLRRLAPWAITLEAGEVVMWLGVPGDVVTEVRFPSTDATRVTVTRKVPAPF